MRLTLTVRHVVDACGVGIVVLIAATSAAIAGSPAPAPAPNLSFPSAQSVNQLALLPDGSAVFAGDFTFINGLSRYGLAKLQANGALDPSWTVCTNGSVLSIAVDAAGNIYLGGGFTGVGPDGFRCMQNTGMQPRMNLARILPNGVLDPDWHPAADSTVYALALDGAGKLYASGSFNSVGGSARRYLARLNVVDGTVDAWNPNAGISVGDNGNLGTSAFLFDGTGSVYLGGFFISINNVSRYGLAKLNPDGTLNASWNPSSEIFNIAQTLAWDGAGNLLVGGTFDHLGGVARANLAKVSTGGTIDPAWNPSTNGGVTALLVGDHGSVYAAGQFTTVGGQPRSGVARLSISDGSVDGAWDPGADSGVSSLVPDSHGNAFAVGRFRRIGGVSKQAVALLRTTDFVFDNGFEAN